MATRRILRSVIYLLGICTLFAACSSSAPKPGQPTAQTQEPGSPTPSTPEPTEIVPADKVAILVVDTFKETIPPTEPTAVDMFDEQPISPTESTKDSNCLIDIDGLDWSWKGSGDINGRPHGEYVFGEIQQELTTLGWAQDTSTTLAGANVDYDMELWKKDNQHIWIVKVDTEGYTTGSITRNISDARDRLTDFDGTNHFVLNMSFGVVACPDPDVSARELYEQYQKVLNLPELAVFKTELEDILKKYDPEDPATKDFLLMDSSVAILRVAAAFMPFYELDPTRNPDGAGFKSEVGEQWQGGEMFGSDRDPLYQFIQENPTIFAVGASGNIGFNFPLAPAMWDLVLAITASPDQERPEFRPNAGEVGMSGISSIDPSIIGTSFAAPKLSAQAAVYLFQNKDRRCETATGISLEPALNYVPQISDTWNSLELSEARQQYCPTFP